MTSFVKNRLLPLLLCAAMLIGMLPVSAFAESTDPTEPTEQSPQPTGETEETEETLPSEPTGETEETEESTEAQTQTEYPGSITLEIANSDYITATQDALTDFTAEENTSVWTDTDLGSYLDMDDYFTYVYDLTLTTDTEDLIAINLDLAYWESGNIVMYLIQEGEILEFTDFTVESWTDEEDPGFYGIWVDFSLPAGSYTLAWGLGEEDTGIPEGAALTGLSLSGPAKTMYFLNEEIHDDGNVYIDITGLTVTAYYMYEETEYTRILEWNQFNEEIDGYALTADDMTTPGEKTVTISYGGYSARFKLWVCEKEVIDEDTGVEITFDTESVISVSVDTTLPNKDQEKALQGRFVGEAVYYDITARYAAGAKELSGKATVTLPIPEGVINPMVLYVSPGGDTVENMLAHDNGDGTMTFVTDHFSTYAVGESTTITLGKEDAEVESTTRPVNKNVWILTDSVAPGDQVLIVSSNSNSGYILGDDTDSDITVSIIYGELTINGSASNQTYIENYGNGLVWTVGSGLTFTNGNNKLGVRKWGSSYSLDIGDRTNNVNYNWTYSGYTLWNSNYNRYAYYYRYYSDRYSSWDVENDEQNVYLYKKVTATEYITSPGGVFSVAADNITGRYAISGDTVTLNSVLHWDADNADAVIADSTGWTVSYQLVEKQGTNPAVVSSINGSTATLSGIEGVAVIRATYFNEENDLTVWKEFVVDAKAPVCEITILDPESNPIRQGEGNAITLVAKPTVNGNPYGGTVTWTSSNTSIATVDTSGKVTGIAPGDVTITASFTVNGKTYSDELELSVADAIWDLSLEAPIFDDNGNVTGTDPIDRNIIIKDVEEGGTYTNIWAVITKDGEDIGQLTPENLKNLAFISSNPNIATVNQTTGEVTFTGEPGVVTITAVYTYDTVNGRSVTDTVTFSVSDEHYYIPEDGTDDFPVYPNEGAIRFDKTATAVGNFSETGVTQVELSMTGVPYTKGNEIDVVIMIDMSTSMNQNGVDRETHAKTAAQEALKILVTKTGTEDEFNNNRVAVYGFNGWNSSADAYKNYVESVYEYYPNGDTGSGTNNYNIDRFAAFQTYDASKLENALNAIQNGGLDAGTNYAAALRQCHLTLEAARSEEGYNRQQYVIFLTDGAASTGFAYRNGNNKALYYYGTLGSNGFNNISTVADQTEWYSYQMKEAGVEVYTIGLQIQGNNDNQTAAANTILQKIAGTKDGNATQTGYEDYAMTIGADDDAAKVVDVFKEIAQKIMDAAKDVKVEDKISDDFTMIFEAPNPGVAAADGDQEYYIEVKDYTLTPKTENGVITDYIRGDYKSLMKLYMGARDGKYYAASDTNGTRYADPVFDQKPLGSSGTMFYWTTEDISDTEGYSGVSITSDGTTYYFDHNGKSNESDDFSSVSGKWYNLSTGAYASGEIQSEEIINSDNSSGGTNKTSQDLIIATPYFVYNAATKMLVWTAEKLSSSELVLSYFLYLNKSGGYEKSNDAMDPGTYHTNDYADLTYSNFQERECQQELPAPQITWYGAQVSYVFYLVNDKGQPVNYAGRVIPFSEAVYVTDVFTHAVTWDDLEKDEALEADRLAADLIPDVFELYDPGATYKIHVYENETESNLYNHFRIGSSVLDDDITSNDAYTTYVFNTKAGDKYNQPQVYAAVNPYLCKGEGTITFGANGQPASYTAASNETQKVFPKHPEYSNGQPRTDVVSVETTGGVYLYYTEDDGTYYTIVEHNDAEEINDFDFFNTTVAFAVTWKPELSADTVVIDYGLDVVINVSLNDSLSSGVSGVRTTAPSGVVMNSGTYTNNNKSIRTALALDGLTVGTATVQNLNEIRVSLDKQNGMQLTEPLEFFYEADCAFFGNSGSLVTSTMYSSVTVIPATTVYYEDEYVTLSTYTNSGGTWTKDQNNSAWTASMQSNATQAADRPGPSKISEVYDADNNYGYDGAYSNCSTYSMNHSAVATVDANTQAIAEFTFCGTRCDIIGLTSSKTGSIMVKVFKGSSTAGQLVKGFFVDTYYGYAYNPDTGEWERVNSGSENTLYQVPVMTVEDLTYGQYTVQVGAVYSVYDQESGNNPSMEFYLDAIRIYNPMGNLNDDAYHKDTEALPEYEELRNKIIAASNYTVTENQDGTVTASGDTINGAVFIDGKGKTYNIADYVSYGPNNEVYLASGQAVAFNLNVPANAKDIQLGLKLASGGSTAYTVTSLNNDDEPSYELSTATDLYYSIWDLRNETIVIKNTGSGILSITNFKITYSTQDNTRSGSAEGITDLLWMDAESVGNVITYLRRSSAPEPTEPTVTEPVVTDPTEPSGSEPVVTDPTEPSETKPVVTDPTEPSETEPVVTDPTEPSETEPVVTDPTEPSETEPVVTDPTEPAETEPTEPVFDPEDVELPFSDVTENDWFRDSVAYVYHYGLMNGVSDTGFAPQSTATRAMIVTVLYRLEGSPAVTGGTRFSDVPEDTWYTDAVCWASGEGIVNGLSETQFGPDRDVTREQLATMLCRYLNAKGVGTDATVELGRFPDAASVSGWALDAMQWAIASGIITGSSDGSTVTLQPGANALRSQIAAILQRFCEKY